MSVEFELTDWAERATKIFNQISSETNTKYYQQSPLNKITAPIDNLIIGINPGSYSPGGSELSPKLFLEGNPSWNNRFECGDEGCMVSKDWNRFFGAVHFFVCHDYKNHPNGFDDDCKTVWTNITPFATKSKNFLKDIHYRAAVPFTVELINILQPKQIFFLGNNIRGLLEGNSKVCHIPILKDNQSGNIIEIGTINGMPYIQLPHPSRNWGFNKFFIPTITTIWNQLVSQNYSLKKVADTIKHEISQWVLRIKVIEE